MSTSECPSWYACAQRDITGYTNVLPAPFNVTLCEVPPDLHDVSPAASGISSKPAQIFTDVRRNQRMQSSTQERHVLDCLPPMVGCQPTVHPRDMRPYSAVGGPCFGPIPSFQRLTSRL